MIIGFTGTQVGMSFGQFSDVRQLIRDIDWTEWHHGCCTGSDEEAVLIVRHWIDYGVSVIGRTHRIIAHPGDNPEKTSRLALYASDEVLPAKPNLKRNHDIVEVSGTLIAAPRQDKEVLRSGTWATIRWARSHKKVMHVMER